MPRKSIEVNKELLVKMVAKAEAENSFETQQLLWAKVTELYNAENPPENVTFSVVCLRVKEWNIPYNTKSAKGRRKGSKLSDEQKQAMKEGRKGGSRVRFSSQDAEKSIQLLREKTPERFHSLVDRIAKGSRAAASKLFCIECVGYVTGEVKNCTSLACPHFNFRPYQKGSEDESEVVDMEEGNTEVAPEQIEENVEA